MGCKPKKLKCRNVSKRLSSCKSKKQVNIKKGKKTDWEPLENPEELGYVCNLWSSTISNLPIRRVEKTPDGNGGKQEPHYEDLTYGENACCNRNGRNICVNKKRKRKYIFFVTRYYGKLEKYRNNEYKYSIVGYYSLKDFRDVWGELDSCNEKLKKRKLPCKKVYRGCFAVRAEDMKFTTIEGAFPLFSEKDNKPHKNLDLLFGKDAKKDCGNSKKWIYKHKIENARHLKGRVGYKATQKLLEYFRNIEENHPEWVLTKNKIKQELKKDR